MCISGEGDVGLGYHWGVPSWLPKVPRFSFFPTCLKADWDPCDASGTARAPACVGHWDEPAGSGVAIPSQWETMLNNNLALSNEKLGFRHHPHPPLTLTQHSHCWESGTAAWKKQHC